MAYSDDLPAHRHSRASGNPGDAAHSLSLGSRSRGNDEGRVVHRPCAPEHQRMSAIDIATSLLRGVHVAALASLFGTLLFAAAALPAEGHTAQMRSLLRRLALGSALAGLIAGIAWLIGTDRGDRRRGQRRDDATCRADGSLAHAVRALAAAAPGAVDRRIAAAVARRGSQSRSYWQARRLPCSRFSAMRARWVVAPARN